MQLAGEADGIAILVDDPLDSIAKHYDVEVDKQTDLEIKQTQMRKKLGFIDRMQGVLAFRFNNYTVLDYQVSTKPTIQFHGFVN